MKPGPNTARKATMRYFSTPKPATRRGNLMSRLNSLSFIANTFPKEPETPGHGTKPMVVALNQIAGKKTARVRADERVGKDATGIVVNVCGNGSRQGRCQPQGRGLPALDTLHWTQT